MTDKTDERKALEAMAAELGLKVPGNISDEKLAERIAKAQEQPILVVRGPKEGFWRAGRQFFNVPRPFFEGDLTDDEIKALLDEPKLAVTGPAAE